MRPACLLLDEPFANLDYPAIRSVLSLIVALHEGRHTIVVITHELEKVLAHATRLAVMEAGCVVYDGAPGGLARERFEAFGLRDPYLHGEKLENLTWLR
jgi:biotin transport system ATP-binding protein